MTVIGLSRGCDSDSKLVTVAVGGCEIQCWATNGCVHIAPERVQEIPTYTAASIHRIGLLPIDADV